jgi:hypothetical protein
VREIDAAALEEAAFLDQPRNAAAAFRALPRVGAEGLAVEGFEFPDDAGLEGGEVGFEDMGVHWEPFCDGLVGMGFGCGVPRLTRGRTSFASPKESSQRKGDPWSARAGPGPLCYSADAGAAQLGPAGLGQCSPFFRASLRCSAPPRGPKTGRSFTAFSPVDRKQ